MALSSPYIVLIVFCCIIMAAFLPFLLTAVYLFVENIWTMMIMQPENYREYNRLRNEWNKTAAKERRRRLSMTAILYDKSRETGTIRKRLFLLYRPSMRLAYIPRTAH